jgi:bifunctional DNA-binding transcriptional regulator/antitoxin component of YhaV-PrlF toxin-antitoxin module
MAPGKALEVFRGLLFRLLPLALLVCVVGGCKLLQSLTRPTVIKSADGKFQITVPAGWRENAGLKSNASIKAGDLRQEMYVLVMTQPKDDFADDVTLDKFTELTLKSISKNVGSAESSPPLPIKINGQEGRQYEVQGIVDSLKIAYLITTVETPEHYHKIVTWTLRSRIDKNQHTLEEVTNSFRELSRRVDIGPPPKQAEK